MSTPFKMKGFSGFGDGTGSPIKKDRTVTKKDGTKRVTVRDKEGNIIKEKVVVKGGPKTVQRYDAEGNVISAKRSYGRGTKDKVTYVTKKGVTTKKEKGEKKAIDESGFAGPVPQGFSVKDE